MNLNHILAGAKLLKADKEHPVKRAGWWGLYLVWFGLVLYLVWGGSNQSAGGLRGAEDLLTSTTLDAESSWMGIYIGGNKVGYVHNELAPLPGGGYLISEISRMSGAMMGAEQQMKLKMSVVTDSTLAMESFEGKLEAAPYTTSFNGTVSNRVLHIELTTGGKTTARAIPAPEPIYLSQAIKPLLGVGRLNANDSLKLAGFDPLSLEMQDLIVYGADPASHMLFGKSVQARKLITRMGGFESSLFIDEEGNSLAEYGPLGIVLKREDMAVALAVDDGAGAVDFLGLFAITPVGRIDDSRHVTRALYKLTGISIAQVVQASGRQSIFGGDTILVDATNISLEFQADFDSSTLKDAPFIESREPAIRKAATLAVKGGISRADSLEKLSEWVFNSILKNPSAGIPSALAVLNTRSGDCNEHTVLFTALARSIGIPTRMELGAVYQAGRFYYHAWPASLVDGKWIEFEPTFGDKRADAARIAFAKGDMSSANELASAIGNITIEIIETSKSK